MSIFKKTALQVKIVVFVIVIAFSNSLAFRKEAAAAATASTRVKISIPSDEQWLQSSKPFETTDLKTVTTIDTAIKKSRFPTQKNPLEATHINSYIIQLSNNSGEYSCKLYYNTHDNKAYIAKNNDFFHIDMDFARYIDSFFENTNISYNVDKTDANLFQKYGWTLDYQINNVKIKSTDISTLSAFQPITYYFAYNNELSKDIGLDMSQNTSNAALDVKLYRIRESMPQSFYPIQDCRGIVVKNGDKVIGAFISAGRHSAFNACSLKGNSFEQATGRSVGEWLAQMVQADGSEKKLAHLTPEQIIQKYFFALNNQDAKLAQACISKETLLENLTVNMSNQALFHETVNLPLAGADLGRTSGFDALKSAELKKMDEIETSDTNTRTFRVNMNLQYIPGKHDVTLDSGEQFWDCTMVYESPQTGWKIKSFGH